MMGLSTSISAIRKLRPRHIEEFVSMVTLILFSWQSILIITNIVDTQLKELNPDIQSRLSNPHHLVEVHLQ